MSQISLPRILFHISGSIIPVTYLVLGRPAALTLGLTLLLMLVTAEFLRMKDFVRIDFVTRQLKEKELKKPTGSLFYCAAGLITMVVFDKYPSCAAMMVLALADPASSIVGRTWGKRKLFFGKTLKGTAAFFLTALVILMCFPFGPSTVLIGAAVATATELVSAKLVDDNLSIPIITALALHLMGPL